jgi:hypothetical protein
MFRLDWLDTGDADFIDAGEVWARSAFELLSATVSACEEAGLLHGHPAELVAVASWSLVHGLAALWTGGRLEGRLSIRDPHQLAAAVSRLFVSAVLA